MEKDSAIVVRLKAEIERLSRENAALRPMVAKLTEENRLLARKASK